MAKPGIPVFRHLPASPRQGCFSVVCAPPRLLPQCFTSRFLLSGCVNSIETLEASVSQRLKPVSLISIWLYNSYLSLKGAPQS